MPDITAALIKCLMGLETETAPDNKKRLPEAIKLASQLSSRLPLWLDETKVHRFEDTEELIAQLPNLLKEWYTDKSQSPTLLAPDLVTKKMAKEAIGVSDAEDYSVYHATQNTLPPAECYSFVLIQPCRFHSLQLSWVSMFITTESQITILDSGGAPLTERIRENDMRQLEFLSARWEIEQNPNKKRERLHEIIELLRAMVGGESI